MKVVLFGTALLACAIPAFAQVGSPIPGTCEAALMSPGVPSAVVVLPAPTPLPVGRAPGSTQRPGIPSSMAPVHPGILIQPSSSPYAIAPGIGTASGFGGIGPGGIGSIAGGIGSIGMGGIGSIVAPGFAVATTPPPVPFTAPLTALTSPPVAGPYSMRANPQRHAGAPRSLPFICP
jgi:hypothetical protein